MELPRLVLRLVGALALVALVATSIRVHAAPADAAAPLTALFPKPGIDTANLDPTCKACDDFYQFATGGWQKANPIPDGYASWGSFAILAEANRNVLHDILEGAAKNTSAAPGSNEQKIGAFYASCMDEAGIEAANLTPVQPELDRIAAAADRPALMAEIARMQHTGINVPLRFDSTQDTKDSSKQTAEIGFGGLGLPERDYYFRDDDKSKSIRAEYLKYIAAMLTLSGDATSAASQAPAIVALESALATAIPKRADLRDPLRTYHLVPVTNLTTMAPGINWAPFLAAFGAPAFTQINVAVPEYVKAVDDQLGSQPLAIWKAYLRFHLIDSYASTLPKRFADASFDFHSTVLSGVKDQLPRWKRCTSATDRSLGEALGAVYVQRVFPPAAKARAVALVNNLQGVLHDDIAALPWMSAPTKARAETKLAAFTKKIGYPDVFRDYTKLTVTNGPYATNVMRVSAFNGDDDLKKIGKPTDRTKWHMSPPTVNAYYSPQNTEIVFPAGILKPPFFSDATDDAVNYGGIGAVIGHEMTHGFDDQGRQFDETGNLNDWWLPADAAAFSKRAQCIVDEFSAFEAAPGVKIQGRLVQGEAIADLGGITIAYKAFARTAEFKSGKMIDGYTPAQRFFLSFANVWARNQREEAARSEALTDPHPDARYRVIGTLSNMPEFRAAFHCAAGDKMVRADSCQIW
jgi:putative endopeptidase